YSDEVRQKLEGMGIEDVLIAPRSRGQYPYVERPIDTTRRDLLDHVIVCNERHLLRLLKGFFDDHYHSARCQQSVQDNSPPPRPVRPARTRFDMSDSFELYFARRPPCRAPRFEPRTAWPRASPWYSA